MAKTLDFLVIGAQKAGTTALFRYLQPHPRIYLPPEKEAPFFSDDDAYALGWEHYARDAFRHAPEDSTWGKVTPQYMCDPVVPERIHRAMPRTRLIAVLRDPVERAVSHYRMIARRKLEQRPFGEAIEESLRESNVADARVMRCGRANEARGYIAWGEYGRILARFLQHFPREQLLVVFAEDLSADPGGVIDAVVEHIGLERGFRPENLGQRYHIGSTKRRLPDPRDFAVPGWIRRLWLRIPRTYRRRFFFHFDQWNVVPDSDATIPRDTDRALTEFFAPDVAKLTALLGRPPPWPRFSG